MKISLAEFTGEFVGTYALVFMIFYLTEGYNPGRQETKKIKWEVVYGKFNQGINFEGQCPEKKKS